MPDTEFPKGIDDLSEGQCEVHLNLLGEDFQCELALHHEGWPHRNFAAQAVWQSGLNA